MASAKPPKPPAHDAKAANAAWRTVKRPDGSEYSVFSSESYVGFTAWLRKVGYEVQNANAEYLDKIKEDVDEHAQAIIDLQADVKVLKEAPAPRPFP